MRIDGIRIGAFGRLHDFDTGPEALAGLVVVLGPNEAGKSTLFSFLTTALYGFQPATRERNPHVPWGGDRATGSIRVQLDSDGCAEVERTLRSQPTARLTVGGRTTELRNQAVPWVSHVPRTVFRQVFAITLGELAGLDEETWARIQDRMIGSMGAADLQSPRAVAEALEREAGEIWRPNRRGNQRLRDVQAALRSLRGRRSEALERDAVIRRLVAEGEKIRTELHTLRERRQLDRAEVERTQSLLPVKRQLDRVAELRVEGGPIEELRGLPRDPGARLAELKAEADQLARQESALETDAVEREDLIARAAATAAILEHRERIVDFAARASAAEHERLKVFDLEGEVAEVEARLDAASADTLTGSWRDVDSDRLSSLSIELLRARLSVAPPPDPPPDGAASSTGPLRAAAAAVGSALLAWGLLGSQPVLTGIGGAALAASVTAWLLRRRRPPPHPAAMPFVQGLDDLLGGLPVRPELLNPAGPALATSLERLQGLIRQRHELLRALGAARDRVQDVADAGRKLAAALGRDAAVDATGLARDLDGELRAAELLRASARTAERDLTRLEHTRSDVSDRLGRVSDAIEALEQRGRALAPGEPLDGLAAARDRLAAHDLADQIEHELARAHPNLDELAEQIAAVDTTDAAWSVDEEASALTRARIEELDERIEELLERGKELEAEVAHLRDKDTVDAVDSEIASLREAASLLGRERDRKWVVAKLLREADRRFREEHQPDLLRRAGAYLRHLTGGRYERLVVDETHADHLFHLVGPTLPAPVPLAPPVSTGALEQAYLSLRLAIVDHLDQGGERLPLFVDEVLVNWDGERRARGLEVLASISGTRQVFVFTCHPSVAAELEERGGRVLELGQR